MKYILSYCLAFIYFGPCLDRASSIFHRAPGIFDRAPALDHRAPANLTSDLAPVTHDFSILSWSHTWPTCKPIEVKLILLQNEVKCILPDWARYLCLKLGYEAHLKLLYSIHPCDEALWRDDDAAML